MRGWLACTPWTQGSNTDIIMNNITTALTILLTIALCVHPGKAAVSVDVGPLWLSESQSVYLKTKISAEKEIPLFKTLRISSCSEQN